MNYYQYQAKRQQGIVPVAADFDTLEFNLAAERVPDDSIIVRELRFDSMHDLLRHVNRVMGELT